MFHFLLAVIYLAFISLGLPDSLLGAAWPSIYQEFGVPVSYAGAVSMIIAMGTIVSSLLSDRLTRRFGTGRVTAVSVATTAVALMGFSFSSSFWMLCLWAVPYGLGAGGVDASLNNYVALHYASRHMSWLHCMWGVGAATGPYIMGFALTAGQSWSMGYRYIAFLQIGLTAILLLSLPMWKKRPGSGVTEEQASGEDAVTENGQESGGESRPLKLPEIVRIPGVREIMCIFFCYCALEQTAGLWASSYLVLHKGVEAEVAASFASLFFIGITVGRAASGFLTMRFCDAAMVRMGAAIILLGLGIMVLPLGTYAALTGFILVGLGCAPVYPCMIHTTPALFGAERSQAIIGVQMASAYVGTCLMPSLFGLIANHIHVAWLPAYLLAILLLLWFMHERLQRTAGKGRNGD